jgi:hypothetical protein
LERWIGDHAMTKDTTEAAAVAGKVPPPLGTPFVLTNLSFCI